MTEVRNVETLHISLCIYQITRRELWLEVNARLRDVCE